MRLTASTIKFRLLFLSGGGGGVVVGWVVRAGTDGRDALVNDRKEKEELLHVVCRPSVCSDWLVNRKGSINQTPPVCLHSTLSESPPLV